MKIIKKFMLFEIGFIVLLVGGIFFLDKLQKEEEEFALRINYIHENIGDR